MKNKRNYGIDLLKIIACILVITLHSLSPELTAVKSSYMNKALYFLGTIAIPVFFMASGYFVINKKDVDYKYSFRRIIHILKVVLSWLLLYSLMKVLIKHKFTFFNELLGSAFTGVKDSHFYHFWFFWALIIVLLIAPILGRLMQYEFKQYIILTLVVTLLCLLQDMSLHLGFSKLMENIPQVFRLNIYILYYLLGGLIGNRHFNSVKEMVKRNFWKLVVLDLILYVLLVMYSIWNTKLIGWNYAEANYNNILVISVSFLTMCIFSVAEPKGKEVIHSIIPAEMGVYVIHYFFVDKFQHITLFSNLPVLIIPFTFIICFVVVKIALKISYLRDLFIL